MQLMNEKRLAEERLQAKLAALDEAGTPILFLNPQRSYCV
jgi:hypothetical protein